MLVVRRVRARVSPREALSWATRAGLEGLSLLHAAGPMPGYEASYLTVAGARRSSSFDPLEDDEPLPSGPEEALSLPRWVGVIPYEATRAVERGEGLSRDARPPALVRSTSFRRAAASARLDDGSVLVAGDDPELVERLSRALATPPHEADPDPAIEVSLDERGDPPEAHLARIERARELIRAGDVYQVCLARRLALEVTSDAPARRVARTLYERLVERAPTALAAFLELDGAYVLSTSPEILLDAAPRASPRAGGPADTGFGALATVPIKGTRPRSGDPDLDRARALELDRDPKERAELAMIVDVERNDLGRVAEVGTVRVAEPPHVVARATVLHRQARVEAVARRDRSRAQIIASIVPSGSVTGAPKLRAMELIAELEAHRRGLYTGGLGFVSHEGRLVLSMAIRTAVLVPSPAGLVGEYLTGGGIVLDSDPAREVEETRWKAAQLLALTGASRAGQCA
jgi:anthranilate/para-aminobenzoate synthase component I